MRVVLMVEAEHRDDVNLSKLARDVEQVFGGHPFSGKKTRVYVNNTMDNIVQPEVLPLLERKE